MAPTTPTAPVFHHVAVTSPPTGCEVIIWWHVGERRATFDGQQWRDGDGRALSGPILYWREVQA